MQKSQDRDSSDLSSKVALSQTKQLPPFIDFPEDLPVSECRVDIQNALAQHQVIIVAGETGSGKQRNCRKFA